MKSLISIAMLLVCSATVAEGQIERVPLVDSSGRQRTDVDSLFVRGFSVGNPTDIRLQEVRTLEQFIQNLATNQQIFLRGTADRYRFPNVSDARNRQLNRNLASGRARRATAIARRQGVVPEILEPWIDLDTVLDPLESWRGVWAYKATYQSTEATTQGGARGARLVPQINLVDSIISIDSIFVFTRDSVRILVTGDTLGGGSGWRFGVGGGVASLLTFGGGGMEFIVPTLSAFAQHDDKWFVTLVGGWRPMSEVTLGSPFPPNMNRAEAIASLTATLYPDRDVLGVAFGIRGAWETVRREDEFLERAYGLTVGPRLRFNTHWLVLGLDFQLSNESRFRGGETNWRFGIAPSMSVNHSFGRSVNR